MSRSEARKLAAEMRRVIDTSNRAAMFPVLFPAAKVLCILDYVTQLERELADAKRQLLKVKR